MKARLMKYNSNNIENDSDEEPNFGRPPQPPSLPPTEAKPPIMIMPAIPSNSVPTITVSAAAGKKLKR